MARIIMVYAMISSGRGLLGETLFHNSFDSLYNHLGLRLYLYIDRVPGLQQGEVRSRQSFRNKVYRKLMLLPIQGRHGQAAAINGQKTLLEYKFQPIRVAFKGKPFVI